MYTDQGDIDQTTIQYQHQYTILQNLGDCEEFTFPFYTLHMHICRNNIVQNPPNQTPPLTTQLLLYLLFKYQLKANCPVSYANGVGTSANPGLATGCLK